MSTTGRTLSDEQLRHFADVRACHYHDELRITQVEPLIAYILSGPARARLNDAHVVRLREIVARTIAEHGALRVRESTGVFLAREPKH